MRKKSHAFSDAIGQKPTLIIYTRMDLQLDYFPERGIMIFVGIAEA